ncbi:xanthine dehydrogenase family protein molybdopterin-binding subunit [Planktotalea arctica]|uniref:xanthine dehydrogenase family protein molybdopterin-binding subunit n=1 Tax=Planktotalea arctica TaxID=1481893 RepID=UPI000A173D76|nr:xanthine dehydrogenase family protein molybdopterin-binding subunit [Planktotalea arctica]
MEKFGKSQPVKRTEDMRFLTGAGRYVDDIAPKDALFGYVFRSPVAHGVIDGLNVDDARAAEGVQMVVTARDLEALGVTLKMQASVLKNRDGSRAAAPMRPLLAKDHVRFVGEPVAMIFADTYLQAKDAAELIEFDYTDLPAHLGLSFGGEALHEAAPENRAFDWDLGDEDAFESAIASAAHRISCEIEDNRIIVNSMEPRGCYAEIEDGRVHVAINGQGVWAPKAQLAKHLNVDPEDIRVTNPDTGGGFGMKAMMYPEYAICAAAARALDKPVRWMSERTEAMLSDNAGRDLCSRVEMGFDADHKLVAYKVHSIANMGAYNSQFAQPIQTDLFSKVLTGCYDVQAVYLHVEGVFTNTTQVDAYRGAGRPEAIYVLERSMDYAARALGVDPWALRRRNFIAPEAFPYTTAADVTYDIGEFDRVLGVAQTRADHAGYENRRNASAANGMLRGMGLCYYIESILGDPSETAKVVFFESEDRVSIYVGTQSNGQGHETVYAQFLSDQSGIALNKIDVIQGDSDRIPTGGGTGGSRSVTVQNTATLATVEAMIAQFTPFLADKMGVSEESVMFDDEAFRADGSNESYTMVEVAELARAEGRTDLLSHEARITLDARSFPNGAHVAEVEIDPATGVTVVDRYTVVDDFGNLINPMLVAGQVHGGVAQGLGQALTERVVYDEDGQLLTASFMDYAMPRADDLPMISFATEAVPTKTNPMGMKGCGEAGTVGALAAIANAVQDAVAPLGIETVDMPFTPHRMWQMLKAGKLASE